MGVYQVEGGGDCAGDHAEGYEGEGDGWGDVAVAGRVFSEWGRRVVEGWCCIAVVGVVLELDGQASKDRERLWRISTRFSRLYCRLHSCQPATSMQSRRKG